MSRLKTFFKYFLAIVIIYFVVNILSAFIMKSTYDAKDYTIENSIYTVEVEEAKATLVNGYINVKIINNTTEKIESKILKIDCYSIRNKHMGTKYVGVKELNSGEGVSFESKFNFGNVDHIKISTIEKSKVPHQELDFKIDSPEDATLTFAIAMGALISIWAYVGLPL